MKLISEWLRPFLHPHHCRRYGHLLDESRSVAADAMTAAAPGPVQGDAVDLVQPPGGHAALQAGPA